MSAIHVLEQTSPGRHRVVMHDAVPAGNNSAGKAWKAVALASGVGTSTILTVGTGPGQITQAEKDQIVAGDVLEYVFVLKLVQGGTSQAAITAACALALATRKAQIATDYAYYGYAQG